MVGWLNNGSAATVSSLRLLVRVDFFGDRAWGRGSAGGHGESACEDTIYLNGHGPKPIVGICCEVYKAPTVGSKTGECP